MYSKEETRKLREAFWTTFGQYMAPILGADGLKVSWKNYKTGVKGLFFRMDSDYKSAKISIEITRSDSEIRDLIFNKFIEYKSLLHKELNEKWIWEDGYVDDFGVEFSRIYFKLEGTSVLRKEDWPKLITFFKYRIIALDRFWSTFQYAFEDFK